MLWHLEIRRKSAKWSDGLAVMLDVCTSEWVKGQTEEMIQVWGLEADLYSFPL